MANKQMERCSISPGQWKLKRTVRYHHISIRISKTRNWQQQTLTRIWRNRNSHSLLVGTQNGIDTLEDNLAVSQESKHTPTIWSSNHDPWYLPKELKPVHTECYSSFTQMPKLGNMWWNIIQHRKEMSYQAIKRHSGKLKIFTKWKKPIWKDYLLCDSIYMTFQKRQNCGDSKKISGCQRLGGGRMNRWGTQDFLGQWKSVWHHNGRLIAYVSLNSQKV